MYEVLVWIACIIGAIFLVSLICGLWSATDPEYASSRRAEIFGGLFRLAIYLLLVWFLLGVAANLMDQNQIGAGLIVGGVALAMVWQFVAAIASELWDVFRTHRRDA